jgi:putative FmdB family regulatory protein
MPLFEFLCSDCNQPFEELLRSATEINEVSCPVCGSHKIYKRISTFASKVTGGSSFSFSPSASASCGAAST